MTKTTVAIAVLWTGIAIAAEPAALRLTGDWMIEVTTPGNPPVRAEVTIAKQGVETVSGERYEKLPDFNANTRAGWTKGARLTGVGAEECTVQGALDPDSLVVREGPAPESRVFHRGVDYEADLGAGTVGRLPGGTISAEQPVFITYRYGKQRIDSIVRTASGGITVRQGVAHAVTPQVPALESGDTRLANVLVSGRDMALSNDSLFPIFESAYPMPPRGAASIAEERLPRTIAKLKSGEPLRILAWGDSVSTYKRYQTMFVERLRERFPKAKIELVTEAWGGRNTGSYLREPPGSEHNYREKVLAAKPDLIISEFVNDASLSEAQVQERYGQLLADFRKQNAEWIILSPHYVRPDWMGLARQRDIDDDPRPYVKGLRRFAAENKVALADASARYGRLWRQGIPYLTLMENNINHPNRFGHGVFADSLMALFE
ncbi:MAG: SGNH/GDSL hydrolase family protein [Bryobacteraceae bacterium]